MRRAPVIATWLLRHFGCSPQTEHVIGDLVERYEQGRSRMARRLLRTGASARRRLDGARGRQRRPYSFRHRP